MNKNEKAALISELAMEVEMFDKIDWEELNISKEEAFAMMTDSVIVQFEQTPDDQKEIVQLATITKLLVENFILNLVIHKLQQKAQE